MPDPAGVRGAGAYYPGIKAPGGKGNRGQRNRAEITTPKGQGKRFPVDREFSSEGRKKYRR
jgi:hypothetical protein